MNYLRGRKIKFKLTRNTRHGSRTRLVSVPPLPTEQKVTQNHQPSELHSSMQMVTDIAEQNNDNFPSSYYRTKMEEVKSWRRIREPLLNALTESFGPQTKTCVVCKQTENNIVRCSDCGPVYFACKECALKDHWYRPLHWMEIWQKERRTIMNMQHSVVMRKRIQLLCDTVSLLFVKCNSDRDLVEAMFVRLKVQQLPCIQLPDHQCASRRDTQKITVIDSQGRIHQLLFSFCKCEEYPLTLARFGLWTASPNNPRFAYSIDLLNLVVYLILESHVSLKGCVEALRWKNSLSREEARTLYRLLVNESFEEYRHLHYRLKTLKHICPDLDDGAGCPACPKAADEPKIVSMDANFGLPRKASSGKSFEPPKHGNRMFLSDNEVQDFVNGYASDSKPNDGECSQFQAGDKVRSKIKNAKLDVTAVFGAICSHEIPVKFLNMKHGERLAYPVFLLQHLLEFIIPNQRLYVLYDIACMLYRHLQKSDVGKDLLHNLKLALPIFHAYGHEPLCQIQYSPRILEDFGTVDGEATERLWSYIRMFGSITKEMTPSHRIDLLTDALLHYGMRKKTNLAKTLVERYKQAAIESESCLDQMQILVKDYGVAISSELLNKWHDEERKKLLVLKQRKLQSKKAQTWQEKYVRDLLVLDGLEMKLRNLDISDDQLVATRMHISQVETRLEKIESTRRMTRWIPGENNFDNAVLDIENHQRKMLLGKLLTHANEREFLLYTKKKHPVGQAVSIRVSRKINKITSAAKKTLLLYNSQKWSTKSHIPNRLLLENVLKPTSELYQILDETHLTEQQDITIPASVKRQTIELMYRKDRAVEEMDRKQKEMLRFREWIIQEHDKLRETTLKLRRQTESNAGAVALMYKKGIFLEHQLDELVNLFKHFFGELSLPSFSFRHVLNKDEVVVEIENSVIDQIDEFEESEVAKLLDIDPAYDSDESVDFNI